jgi:hypothetical protein
MLSSVIILLTEHTGFSLDMTPEMIVIVTVTATAMCGYRLSYLHSHVIVTSALQYFPRQHSVLHCTAQELDDPRHSSPFIRSLSLRNIVSFISPVSFSPSSILFFPLILSSLPSYLS